MKWLILLVICTSLYAKDQHPITKLNQWFQDEKRLTEGRFVKLATLATISPEGTPRTRLVEVMKLHPKNGVVFYTHAKTRKVDDLTFHPHAALNIWLPKTHRQASIEGTVTQVALVDAEKAWNQMPRFIKLTFLGSKHEGVLESKAVLEARRAEIQKKYPESIPMPETFIGYSFQPTSIVFFEMQGRDFPHKEVATLENETWTICQFEP